MMETNEIQKIKKESQLTEQVGGMENRVEDLHARCREIPGCDPNDLEDLHSREKSLKSKLTSLKTTSAESEWSDGAEDIDHALEEMEEKNRRIRSRLSRRSE